MISEKKAQELLAQIKDDVKAAEDAVMLRLDKWLERMAFYRGLHYTVQDGSFHLDLDDPVGEAREVHNFIPSLVKAAVATRIQHFPNPQVPAVDNNQKSLARARATERLLKSFVDDDILTGEEFVRALHSAAILGGAWLKIYWDPFSGKPVPNIPNRNEIIMVDDETGETVVHEVEEEIEVDIFGSPIPIKGYEGRIKVAFVDLFDGWPDPCATTPDELRFFVHRKVRPIEELQREFPKDLFGNKVNWNSGSDAAWAQKQSVLSTDNYSLNNPDEGVLIEYWLAPNEDFPNGMLCVYSGNSILSIGPCILAPARLPVVFLGGDNIVPGGLYPDGVVEHLIQPQKTLNRAESKMRELLDRMLNPHILVPHAADVDAEIFGEVGGQVIYYNAGYPPHILHAPEIPSSMFSLSQAMVERMQAISTYSDITRGNVPGRVESGRAISFLQENENNIRTAEVRLYKRSVLDAMMHCLWVAKQNYPQGRLIRTLSEEAWTYFEFNSDDYDWDIDLAPEPFSGAPNSRALRWAETMEAWQQGLFNDEMPGAKEVRRMLELDNQDRSTIDKGRVHRNLALMENQQIIAMSKGAYPGPVNPVREFQDNEIHLEEHNAFRNSQEYLDLTPAARQALDYHCEEHESNLSAQMSNFAGNMNQLGPALATQPAPVGEPGKATPSSGGPEKV